ncbi:MAG TPA: hypothetical protein VKU82_01120, partial [Planctomycetaceae bacterium]|nr:hypothetical protein [Planctomycetaceae bacterium]
YKSFGVQLEFVPTILSSGRLRMQVSPEVSSKDLSNTVVVQGITVPSLITRRVNTEVEMNFGETLIIAGLISKSVQANTQKIPFLGELPWIGAAFRRVNHNEAETELIVLVTPELVSPVDESQLPDGPGQGTVSPTDRELYFNGYLETPRYARDPDPPPTNFGFSPGYAPPPNGMGPPGMQAPRPPYDAEGPGGPPPAMNLGPGEGIAPNVEDATPRPAPSPPAPAPEAQGVQGGPAGDDAASSKAPQSTARKTASPRRTAGAGSAVKPLRPMRVVNRPGPIAPASGIKPANNRVTDAAGDSDRPGLIAP